MTQSYENNPAFPIETAWREIFLEENWKDRRERIIKRPPEEHRIILDWFLRKICYMAIEELFNENRQDLLDWVHRYLVVAAWEIDNNNVQAREQVIQKACEIYSDSNEKGLDSKGQDEQVVRYLLSVPDLWERTNRVPSYEDVEEAARNKFLSKLRALVVAWDAEKETWREAPSIPY